MCEARLESGRYATRRSATVLPCMFAILVAALSSGCAKSDTAGSTATHWLRCEDDGDCGEVEGGRCDDESYCLDSAGDRVAVMEIADAGTQPDEPTPEPTVECVVKGETYALGESFQSPFNCNTCVCTAQGPDCTLLPCPAPRPEQGCPPDTTAGTACIECAPGGGCARYFTDCLEPCLDCGFSGMTCDPDLRTCVAICN